MDSTYEDYPVHSNCFLRIEKKSESLKPLKPLKPLERKMSTYVRGSKGVRKIISLSNTPIIFFCEKNVDYN